MRIADKMNYNQVNNHLTKNRAKMSELQNQAATMKRVTTPSDDPVAAARVLGIRVDQVGNRQFVKSLNYARSFLEYTDQTLADLTENLVRAKELALSQVSDASANEQSRLITATEIEQVFNQMVLVGNRKLGERFIFGGFKTTAPPFDSDGRYFGDNGQILIHTDKEAYVAMNIPGSKVFLGQDLREGEHLQGEQPRTVEELVAQKKPERNNPNRPAEVEPTPAPAMRGPASVGNVQRNENISKNESKLTAATNSRSDKPSVNVFNVVKQMEIALRTNDKETLQDLLTDLDTAISQVILSRSTVGARGTTLDALAQTLEKSKVDNLTTISSLEDADVFETVTAMNQNESTLQATLQTSSKLINKSLLDFMS